MGLNNIQTGGSGGLSDGGLRNLTEIYAIPDSAIHQWKYSEGSGDTFADSIGSADGTRNGFTWVSGDYVDGFAADYGSGSNYGDVGTLGDFGSQMANDFAIAFTVETTDQTDFAAILAEVQDVAGEANIFRVRNRLTDELEFYLADSNGDVISVYGDAGIWDGQKHRVVVNKTENSASGLEIWVDGEEIPTTTSNDGAFSNPQDFSTNFRFAAQNAEGSMSNHANVTHDNPITFGDSLTATQIQDDFEAQPWAAVTDGGITITEESTAQVTDRSEWQGRPSITELSDGTWAMIYRDGPDHSGSAGDGIFHIKFSDGEGATWTADETTLGGSSVSGAPFSLSNNAGGGIIFECPNGDLLVQLNHQADNSNLGTVQFRSTDGGQSWTDEGQVSFSNYSNSDDELLGGQDHFIHPSSGDIYISLFVDPNADSSSPYASGIAKSTDNGNTWEYLAEINSGTNEVGIEFLGNDEVLAVLREDGGGPDTWQATSTDLGSTWSAATTIDGVFDGSFHRPRLRYDGQLTGGSYTDPPLWMVGRDYTGSSDPYQIVVVYSTDDGDSWSDPFVFDSYADAAYSDLLARDNGDYYLATYGGTSSDTDVLEYVFSTSD